MRLHAFLLFFLLLVLPAAECRRGRTRVGFASFTGQGDYCSKRVGVQCCTSRDDNCTAAILVPRGSVDTNDVARAGELIEHLCYCDYFCDREASHDGNDCCPDFYQVCEGSGQEPAEGEEEETMPPLIGDEECSDGGIAYGYGQAIRRNCNTCTCLGNRWQCSTDKCLIQESLLGRMEDGRRQYSWTAQNYSSFWGWTLDEGIRHRLGTIFPDNSVENMNEILIERRELPASFDAREKWPALAQFSVRDQGDCASSWAFSTTRIAADRLAIVTDGAVRVELSTQQLLDCNQQKQKGCEGGYLDRAWWYIRKFGLVSEECYAYSSGVSKEPGQCQIPKQSLLNAAVKCSSSGANSTVYKMTPPYRISMRQEDIMTEILINGPVQATFLVHEDFFMYRGGVYRKLADSLPVGYHSVKIFGWGEEEINGKREKYWLCANSWGAGWGEADGGLFRIVRGENHCKIESFVIGAWAKQELEPLRPAGKDGSTPATGTRRRRRRRKQRKKWRLRRKPILSSSL